MIPTETFGRWVCKVCFTGVLIGGLGCQPSGTSTGLVPVTTKPAKQQENKDQPGKQPKPDVGKSPHPFGPTFIRTVRNNRTSVFLSA
jgi:hypothetical protein